jgi:hypothetical protein
MYLLEIREFLLLLLPLVLSGHYMIKVSIPNQVKEVAKTLFFFGCSDVYCKGATLSGCFILKMPTGVSSMEVKIRKVAIL